MEVQLFSQRAIFKLGLRFTRWRYDFKAIFQDETVNQVDMVTARAMGAGTKVYIGRQWKLLQVEAVNDMVGDNMRNKNAMAMQSRLS